MRSKIMPVLMSCVLVLGLCPVSAPALDIGISEVGASVSGTAGKCIWKLEDGCLTISPDESLGSNAGRLLSNTMDGYASSSDAIKNWGWYNQRDSITSVVFENGVYLEGSAGYMFYGYKNLKSVDLSGFDVSNVESMNYMFAACSALENLDMSGLSAPKLKTAKGMFSGCSSLAGLKLPECKGGALESLLGMFTDCASLQSVSLTSVDMSSATTLHQMFYGCRSLEYLDLAEADLS